MLSMSIVNLIDDDASATSAFAVAAAVRNASN
jgi:hypothetical protein